MAPALAISSQVGKRSPHKNSPIWREVYTDILNFIVLFLGENVVLTP